MRVLLDSHVALWWLEDSRSLGPLCRELIVEADEAYVSAAFEIDLFDAWS